MAHELRSADLPRDLALETAILEAPREIAPRLVYGDWLQARGVVRGEWVALSAAAAAAPADPLLRAAEVAFLDKHRGELLGAGASLLPGMWIGWHGGFIDELRLQRFQGARGFARAFDALLGHPSCRFVRTIALGELPRLQDIIDTLARAAPPLLEALVLVDDHGYRTSASVDRVLGLATLRRLALKNVTWSAPLPALVELFVSVTDACLPSLRVSPTLEELTLDCHAAPLSATQLTGLLAEMPALRRLRVINASNLGELVRALVPHLPRLELLDLSHTTLDDDSAKLLLGARHLQLLALHTRVSAAMEARLRTSLASIAISHDVTHSYHDLRDNENGTSWLAHRVATEGRDALRLVPAAGRCLYATGTRHSLGGHARAAVPLLDAAVTLPSNADTKVWANAAIAHARLGEYGVAERIAREAVIRAPREPNFFAILQHAQRCAGRAREAIKLTPRVRAALANPNARHSVGTYNACLASALYSFAQAGKHDELLAFANEHARLLDPNMHAIIAMSLVALNRMRAARAAFEKASDKTKVVGITADPRRRAVFDHAVAVFALAARPPDRAAALAALARAVASAYYDVHWLATDPNLAVLHGDARLSNLLGR